MKRSAELIPLSHDHHQALFVALQLKRAADDGPGMVFLEFFDLHGDRHFEIEETILIPAWTGADPEADPDVVERIRAEHGELRSGAHQIRIGATGTDELRALGRLLEAHVRFEEREVFPAIEAALDDATLATLGAAIAAAEAG